MLGSLPCGAGAGHTAIPATHPPPPDVVEPACCGCGALLQDPDGLPLTDVQLRRTHTFCPSCGEPAFGPDPQGPRRYAPAEFIKRHLRGVFDLFIPDEVHELKGAATGQGHAYGALAAGLRSDAHAHRDPPGRVRG